MRQNPLVTFWLVLAFVFVGFANLDSVTASNPMTELISKTFTQEEGNPQDSTEDSTEDSAEASTDNAEAASDENTAASEDAVPESGWIDNVNDWFGDYLVTPMATVLFFDFFTGPRPDNDTDDDGNWDHPWTGVYNWIRDTMGVSEKGWLRLGPGKIVVATDREEVKSLVANNDLIEFISPADKDTKPDYIVVLDQGDYIINDGSGSFIRRFKAPSSRNIEPGAISLEQQVASVLDAYAVNSSNGTTVPFAVLWLLLGGLFFTFRMTFINIRAFWHAIRLTRGDYDDPNDKGDVSHFQALSAALSATVGLGNIAGVAIAISTGGPGATVWMVIIGLVGMSSKFTECSLGQMYRKIDVRGKVTGGPMIYLKEGLAEMGMGKLGMFLAFFFSILCIGGSIGGGNTFQVVQSLGAIQQDEAFWFLQNDQYPWIYGVLMVILVGLVIVGGIKSIGKVAGRVVPFMCGIYVIFAMVILAMNAGAIPEAFAKILSQALNPQAIYGGFVGVLVIGITRAVFSNEAGTGSAAIAHSAARTDIPVREGIVALLEPFIDTVVVCTMTALVIVVTGAYCAESTEAMRAAGNGAALTSHAFQHGGFVWFKYVLYAAVFLFAFSTCISWSYYGERCFTHWFGAKSSIIYKIIFLIFTFLGSVVSASNIQAFSDILILSMALPNILGVLLLSGKVRKALDDYWNKVKSGEIQPHSAGKTKN